MTVSKRRKAIKKIARERNSQPKKVTLEEMTILAYNDIDVCGYLRKRKFDGTDYFGTCALQNFGVCDYPCHLPNLANGKYDDFKCPTYKKQMRKYKNA